MYELQKDHGRTWIHPPLQYRKVDWLYKLCKGRCWVSLTRQCLILWPLVAQWATTASPCKLPLQMNREKLG